MGHDTEKPDTGAVVQPATAPRTRKRKTPTPKPEAESLTARPRRSRVARAPIVPTASSSAFDSLLAAVAGEESALPVANAAATAEDTAPEATDTRAKIKLETTTSRDAIATTLESLAMQLRAGSLSVEEGGVGITLTVPGKVALDVHATRKGKRGRLELRLSWKS